MTRQLQILKPRLILDEDIKLCCSIFFGFVNNKLRATLPEYQNAKIHDNKKGIIFCPECVIKRLTKEADGST